MKNKKFASFLAAAAALVLLAMPAFAADEQTELPAAEAAEVQQEQTAAPAEQETALPTDAQTAGEPEQQLTYVALGDSIVSGVGLPDFKYTEAAIGMDVAPNFEGYPEQCYVSLVGKGLGLDRQHAINLGLPGLTTGDLADMLHTGAMPQMNQQAGTYYVYPQMLDYIRRADIISVQVGSNDALVPALVALGNATNWKSEQLVATMVSGVLREPSFENLQRLNSDLSRLRLTREEKQATTQLLLGGVLFTVQLYADFSGYTDIVLGAGEMLGLPLPENFRQPFLAATIRELWDRWHISLSRWLKDYVYIPLGGSRCSAARRDGNIIATFLVSGLWHGAGLTYLVWGFAHGALQALENHLPWRKAITRGWARLVGVAGTFTLLLATFTVFRASSLANAAAYFGGILHNGGHKAFSNYWELGLTSRQEQLLLFFGLALVIAVDLAHERGIHFRDRLAAAPRILRWAVYEGALFLFLFMGYFLGGGGFLYAIY